MVKLKESEKKVKKKLWNMKVTMISIVIGALGTVKKCLIKSLEDLEIRGRVETHPIHNIIKIGQNTKKSY